jgi:hypothetical protein
MFKVNGKRRSAWNGTAKIDIILEIPSTKKLIKYGSGKQSAFISYVGSDEH